MCLKSPTICKYKSKTKIPLNPLFMRVEGYFFVVEVTGLEPTASASRTQRSTKLSHTSLSLVRMTGLEPTRHCCHWHLKPARLPIPPHPRIPKTVRNIISQLFKKIKYFLKKIKNISKTTDEVLYFAFVMRDTGRFVADIRKMSHIILTKIGLFIII